MMKKRLKIWWMTGMTAAVLCLAAGCGNRTTDQDRDNGVAEDGMDSGVGDNENVNDVTSGEDGNSAGGDRDNLGEDVKDGVEDAGEDVGKGIEDVTEGVGEGVKDVGEGIGEGVEDLTGGADNNNNGK